MSRGRIVGVWWIACLLWSCGWLFLKIGLSDLPPITFAALRLGLALLVLAAIVTVRHEWRPLRRRDLPAIAVSGLLLLGVNYALTFWGAQFLPSALTSVLQATSPVFGFAIGIASGAERFSVGAAGAAAGRARRGAGVARTVRGGHAAGLGSAAVVAARPAPRGLRDRQAPARTCRRRSWSPRRRCARWCRCSWLRGARRQSAAVIVDPQAVAALLYLGIASSVVAFWLNYWLLKP